MAKSKPRRSNTVRSTPGSVADVVERLVIWGRLAATGLARVAFTSEYARQRAVDELRAAFAASNVPFYEVELTPNTPATHIVRQLKDRYKTFEPGVVSLAGLSAALPFDKTDLVNSLRILNFNRENLAMHPLRQIWWMSTPLAETFSRAVLDIDSWFIVRTTLTETMSSVAANQERMDETTGNFWSWEPSVNIDQARRNAAYLSERFHVACASGAPLDDLRRLATASVAALQEGGAEAEAHAVARQLELEIREISSLSQDLKRHIKPENILMLGGKPKIMDFGLSAALTTTCDVRTESTEEPVTAMGLSDLAQQHARNGRYTEAELLYIRAVSIWEGSLGRFHPITAADLNDLAHLYANMGRYTEAEPLYVRALSVWEQALGPDHPGTATGLNNLASLYFKEGRYTEAEPLYSRALTIYENALGQGHPLTARSLQNLASLYCDMGRHTEAEPLYGRALRIYDEALGPTHPRTISLLENYADLLQAGGRDAEAAEYRKRVDDGRARHEAENAKS